MDIDLPYYFLGVCGFRRICFDSWFFKASRVAKETGDSVAEDPMLVEYARSFSDLLVVFLLKLMANPTNSSESMVPRWKLGFYSGRQDGLRQCLWWVS